MRMEPLVSLTRSWIVVRLRNPRCRINSIFPRIRTVSPAFTAGLVGKPNELKLKYLADNDFKELEGEELRQAIMDSIKAKGSDLVGNMVSEGTTPRQLTDLIGSLCDLTSGSGDKGTPIVLVQGYFDNYTTD